MLPVSFVTFVSYPKIIPMESRRQQQIGKEIQKVVSALFQKSGPSYYGKAFVTITHVKVTPDLLVARIYLSVFNVTDKQQVVDEISAHTHEIRYQMGNEMRHQLRRIPDIQFFLDETLDYVYKMEDLFKDIQKPSDDEPEA